MKNVIRYKGIQHEITSDAPFIGARILANHCNRNCKGCFNQHLRDESEMQETAMYIIMEVINNQFNNGIILGGLDWTMQIEDMLDIISTAVQFNLKIMIYTGDELEEFFEKLGHYTLDYLGLDAVGDSIGYIGYMTLDRYLNGKECYIKYGEYDESKLTENNIQYGVKLASSNQGIYHITN